MLFSDLRLDLTDEEEAALLEELNQIIKNDRYPFSQRIRFLHSIRANSSHLPREPLPARLPIPGGARPEAMAAWKSDGGAGKI